MCAAKGYNWTKVWCKAEMILSVNFPRVTQIKTKEGNKNIDWYDIVTHIQMSVLRWYKSHMPWDFDLI